MKEIVTLSICVFAVLLPCQALSQEDIFAKMDPNMKKHIGIDRLNSQERIKLSKFMMATRSIESNTCPPMNSAVSSKIGFINSEVTRMSIQIDDAMDKMKQASVAIHLKDPIILDISLQKAYHSLSELKFLISNTRNYIIQLQNK